MRNIVVSGANKGIGLAIVEGILQEQDDCRVFLGSRDPRRGEAARNALVRAHPDWESRIDTLELDVTSEPSVAAAASTLRLRCAGTARPLFGLVNNAGTASGSRREVLEVNTAGVRRVCDALLPLLSEGGRVVNITSAAGPNFVAECSPSRQRLLLDPSSDLAQLDALVNQYLALQEGDFTAAGLGTGAPYGFSKACTNAYTVWLARQHPHLFINACTPGFIETDLSMALVRASGRSPADLSMKTPREGARVALFLLFSAPGGSGHYYGSDCRRSPLDRYRAPGSPAYRGD